jgi:hypothetical protein
MVLPSMRRTPSPADLAEQRAADTAGYAKWALVFSIIAAVLALVAASAAGYVAYVLISVQVALRNAGFH